MPEINIDRLNLKLSGISEQDGQDLSRLIAQGLVDAPFATEGVHHLDAVRVKLTAAPGGSMDLLAKQIVADVLRQLESAL